MKLFKFFQKRHSDKDLQMFDFLRKAEILEALTDDELAHFLPYLYLREYKKNEVVFFSGDPSHALYMVKKGIVTLNLDIEDTFEKLMTMRSGRLFGDNALLPNAKRIYSAIVETEQVSLYVLPKENVQEIMNNHPLIKAKIMSAFSKRYNDYTARLFSVYKSSLGFFDLNTVYSGA